MISRKSYIKPIFSVRIVSSNLSTRVLFCGKSFVDDLEKALDVIYTKPIQTEKAHTKIGRSFYLDVNKLDNIRKFRKNRK